jgi:Ca2+-binding RTX toxin-like protein
MRRMLGLVAVAATLAIAVPATADAATVHSQTGTGPGGVPYYYLYYDGEPGENNDVQIDDASGTIVFDDVVPVTGVCLQGKPGAPGDTTARTCPTANLTRVIVAVWGGTNKVDATGTAADLLISGTGAPSNDFSGGSGDDQLIGDTGNDRLDGGPGADDLFGGAGADTADYSSHLAGVTVNIDDQANDGSPGEGDNVKTDVENVVGSGARDLLTAQEGNVSNAFLGGGGPDILVGGAGNDITLAGGPGDDEIYAGPGNDGLYGGLGDDLLFGGTQDDLLLGEQSNDHLHGGTGADTQFGGEGQDRASYLGYMTPVSVNLDGLVGDGADGENDRVGADIEDIVGGDASDRLVGNDQANVISGDSGDDEIVGNGGSDTLLGDGGGDTMRSADGAADTVDCGADGDLFEADGLDALTGCETSLGGGQPTGSGTGTGSETGTAPAQGTETPQTVLGPLLRIRPLRLRLTPRGVARLRVGCPAAARERCTGTLRLKRGRRTLGSRRFSIAAGTTGRVTIRLSKADRRAIPPTGLRVRAVASARDAASSARVSRRRLRILPASAVSR